MVTEIKLWPEGCNPQPVFKSEDEYQKFRQSFIDEVAPEMEKHRLARLRSEHESMFRIVD